MDLSDSKLQKLSLMLKTFVETQMVWEPLENGEKEPSYTSRVLAPQVQNFLGNLNEPGLQLKADGDLRPVPIAFDGRQFYPDISIDHFTERNIAIECKFLGQSHLNAALTTAIGQAVVYRSLGYRAALVLLVSRTGDRCLPPSVQAELSGTLALSRIAVSELHLSQD